MDITLSVRSYKHAAILMGMGSLTLFAMLFSLGVGAVNIPVIDVAIILVKHFGLFVHSEIDTTYEVVLNSIRLPRIIMTLLIGGALGVSGASLQGLFRNPLVEPSLIGVSGGSAAFVVTLIVFGSSLTASMALWMYSSVLSIAAFIGGGVATFLVLKLSSEEGKTNIAVLILVGVAINALTGALIGLAIFYADENQLRTFTFWTLGDLGGATWDKLKIAIPLLSLSTLGQLFFCSALNALALGEGEAFHLGVNVEKVKKLIILLCAISVGVSVSLSGIIGFIGLVVPHVIRTSFHSDNRLVLPASVLGGAFMLLIADVIARTIVRPAELPIGVVTALIGAPFFITLLMKAKVKHEL